MLGRIEKENQMGKKSRGSYVVLPYLIVLSAFLGVLSGPVLAVDNGLNIAPVMYYDPGTGQSTPFFPIGWYTYTVLSQCGTPQDLQDIGANTFLFPSMRPHEFGAIENRMDIAQSLGMKVVVGIHRWEMDDVDPGDPSTYTDITLRVNRLKDHPALLGWQLGGELDCYDITPTEVVNAATIVHTLDPNRQIWLLHGTH